MDIQTCANCKRELPVASFAFRNKSKGIRGHECRDCHSERFKSWYGRHAYSERDRLKQSKLAKRKWLVEYKVARKCERCGEDHPACLEFHHLNSDDKDIDLGRAVVAGWSIARMLEEIAKCILLCANCHRKLHYDAASSSGKTADSDSVDECSIHSAVASLVTS